MASFHFYKGATPQQPLGILLKLDSDVLTGSKNVQEHFGGVTTLETDLLTIAASIFAVDRGHKRGEREEFARLLELHIPVTNVGRLQPLIPIVE